VKWSTFGEMVNLLKSSHADKES